MLSSMTAFSRDTLQDDWGNITWEVRTVNHRYLDMSVRLPELLRQLEPKVRELVGQHLKRGKVEVTLKFQAGKNLPFEFEVNKKLVAKLAGAAKEIEASFSNLNTSVVDLLNWQGVLQVKDAGIEKVEVGSLAVLDKVLNNIKEVRQREGAKIADFLQARMDEMSKQVKIIETKLPEIIKVEREHLLQRFEEMKIELDQDRVDQEMVWLMQKMDVAEELQRIDSHMQEVAHVLKNKRVVGRRLDFLMQELNREANTLSSKSSNVNVTKASVELKVLIEQMREQVQNIE